MFVVVIPLFPSVDHIWRAGKISFAQGGFCFRPVCLAFVFLEHLLLPFEVFLQSRFLQIWLKSHRDERTGSSIAPSSFPGSLYLAQKAKVPVSQCFPLLKFNDL
jgi:hypothetical protein